MTAQSGLLEVAGVVLAQQPRALAGRGNGIAQIGRIDDFLDIAQAVRPLPVAIAGDRAPPGGAPRLPPPIKFVESEGVAAAPVPAPAARRAAGLSARLGARLALASAGAPPWPACPPCPADQFAPAAPLALAGRPAPSALARARLPGLICLSRARLLALTALAWARRGGRDGGALSLALASRGGRAGFGTAASASARRSRRPAPIGPAAAPPCRRRSRFRPRSRSPSLNSSIPARARCSASRAWGRSPCCRSAEVRSSDLVPSVADGSVNWSLSVAGQEAVAQELLLKLLGGVVVVLAELAQAVVELLGEERLRVLRLLRNLLGAVDQVRSSASFARRSRRRGRRPSAASLRRLGWPLGAR